MVGRSFQRNLRGTIKHKLRIFQRLIIAVSNIQSAFAFLLKHFLNIYIDVDMQTISPH